MSDDLRSIETWASGLLARLQPAERRTLYREIAIALRRNQTKRIASQKTPDGKPYVPRKNRHSLRSKQGHIQRRKEEMFKKIKLNKYLKTQFDVNQISVGFFGRVARIARVHQQGLKDQISRRSKTKYLYPRRPLLGFSSADQVFIRDVLLRNLTS